MQSLRLLPFALALTLVTGCDKSDANAAGDAMKSAGDAAKGAVQQASTALDGMMKDLDLSNLAKLDAAKLQELGKSAMATVATQLGNIKDLASAKSVSGALTPMLEKLDGLKTALGGKLPDLESVKSAISSLTTKFPTGGEVMEAIKPMLAKLTSLVG